MATKPATQRKQPSANDRKKAGWRRKNDRGPHKATLPSGEEVTFLIPNSTELIRADMLPDRLSEIAIMAAAYPDGAEGYLADLGMRASRDEDEAKKLKDALKQGLELRDWLVSEMLVDPALTPEEVGSGEYPDKDIEMLIEFAERRRNTDAKGVELAIAVLDDVATFPGVPVDPEGADDLEAGGDPAEVAPGGGDGA